MIAISFVSGFVGLKVTSIVTSDEGIINEFSFISTVLPSASVIFICDKLYPFLGVTEYVTFSPLLLLFVIEISPFPITFVFISLKISYASAYKLKYASYSKLPVIISKIGTFTSPLYTIKPLLDGVIPA